MSKYIIVGTYSDEGAAGLVSGDTDRVEAMEALCDSVGAKLVSAYITRGLFDFCVMVEADSFEIIAAMLLKVRATGAIGEIITLEAVDYKSIRGIAKGVKYTPPKGQIVIINTFANGNDILVNLVHNRVITQQIVGQIACEGIDWLN